MPGRFRWTRDVRFIANTQTHPTATNHGVSQEDAYHLFAYRTMPEMARRATTRRQGTPFTGGVPALVDSSTSIRSNTPGDGRRSHSTVGEGGQSRQARSAGPSRSVSLEASTSNR